MKNLKSFSSVLSMVLILACFYVSALGQSAEDKNRLATITGGGSSVRWEVAAPYSELTVTVSAPDGQVFRKEFKAGASPEFTLSDKEGNKLPDGQYTYELRLTPVLSPEIRKELKAAREKSKGDDDAATERDMRKRGMLPTQPLVQSGSFTILRGQVIVAGATEPAESQTSNKITVLPPPGITGGYDVAKRMHHFLPLRAMPDVVTPDDAIIQGSLCVGLDCVNNESFGFDTIRLKENNTRIKFDDTSTSAGFPANDWQLTANDSASGGSSKFSIEDITGSKVPFTITAGAATNSIFVDSTGRLGLRTSTPVLDVHVNTSNTPAFRMEQNNSGGFTAQTWDIAGNEANFFVRDVTGGSRLPFRIRPGAPTSSIDINASGNVGIGTASAGDKLEITKDGAETAVTVDADVAQQATIYLSADGSKKSAIYRPASSNDLRFNIVGIGDALSMQATTGNIGIATNAPTDKLSVNGSASKPGGGSWSVFSDERLKNIKGQFNSGLSAVMQLQPLRYEYKPTNALGINSEGEHIGFGAQALQKIIPEAVTRNANGYLLVNNDPILWTMLNAIKEQQKEIEQLRAQIRQLQPRAGRSNRPRQRRR